LLNLPIKYKFVGIKDNLSLKSLIYRFIQWYVLRFTFPSRGEKYFSAILKHFSFFNKPFIKKLHNGQLIRLIPQDHIQRTLLWYGFYEKESIQTWEKLIVKDSVVIDIGANIGYYTLIAAHKAINGSVHSFEPVPTSFQALQKNISLNNLSNVIANPCGVSNVQSLEKYYVSSIDNSGMSGMRPAENFSGLVETINTITIDDYSSEHELRRIDFIKIDIEGNELNALMGMKKVLQKFKPIIFIELVQEHLVKYDTNIAGVYSFLRSYNYAPYEIVSSGVFKTVQTEKESDMMVFLPPGNPGRLVDVLTSP
jgi:FkbM family methyltransferase